MLYTLSFILIMLAIIKKNSKATLILLFMYIIFLYVGGNANNQDRIIYLNNYYYIADGLPGMQFEFGFQALCKFGSFFGLPYNFFLAIIMIVGLLLIVDTIRLYTSNIAFVLALYFIYPFIWDTVQIRNFLAMSIIVFGLRFILSEKKEYLKFSFFVLMAASIHVTAIFYFSFLITAFIKDTKKLLQIVLFITGTSIIFSPYLAKLLLMVTSVEKVNSYTTTQTSIITKLLAILYFLVSILLIYFLKKNIEKEKTKYSLMLENNGKKILDLKIILQINIISVIMVFFVMNNLNFFRLYRNIFILNYVLFAIYVKIVKKNVKNKFIYWIFMAFIILSLFVLVIYTQTTNIFNPLFEENSLLPFLNMETLN